MIQNWFVLAAGVLYGAATIQAIYQRNWKVMWISLAYSGANFVISTIKS